MTTTKLRALTLHPEWAWAICHLDKRVENRPERVARMVLNVVGDGWLAIHAGKHYGGRAGNASKWRALNVLIDRARYAGWGFTDQPCLKRHDFYRIDPWRCGVRYMPSEDLAKSSIVALTRVCRGDPDSPWSVPGQAQIGLRDLFVLPEPVPCGGKQGLWTVSDDVAERVLSQVPRE